MRSFLEKWKDFFTDTVWSAAALFLMNSVVQLAVYPYFSRHMGDEQYGNILYLVSLVNIVAASIGGSANNLRLKESAGRQTENGDYNIMLLGATILTIPFTAAIALFGGVSMNAGEAILFWLLICVSIFRVYSDAAFRLALNYHRYFWYYFFISLGYLVGVFLFVSTGYWILTLLMGELLGILYAVLRSNLYRERPLLPSTRFHSILLPFLYLFLSRLLVNIVYNSDRAILKFLIGGTAVTTYYLASLAGKLVSLMVAPLNSVLIGYLARYKGVLTKKLVFQACFVLLTVIVVGTLVCSGASYVFIYLIYPQNLETVRPYILIATLPQLVYVSSSVFNVFLLRFAEEKYQVVINIIFLAAIICFALPLTKMWGFIGFSVGYLIAMVVRFVAIFALTLRACKEDTM